ncbi:uncharacterized protein LOC135111131 [Scylla paramamosain]|uniref:uncharacterized protein LOC135111131 n=1 Tax=Scylla paramamosain TaxID=85552 RepID=UPI00308277ED
MTVTVAYGGSDSIPGGEASPGLPSLVTSEFRHSSDVGFMRVVEEASRASPLSQITIGNMEPFLRKRGQSPASRISGLGWDAARNADDAVTFDWSRNISKVKDTLRSNARLSSKERNRGRSTSQPTGATLRRHANRWRGDGIMTPTNGDAVPRQDHFSEVVVDITSREPSPLARHHHVKWPSVVSLHGRTPSGRRRHRRNSLTKDKNKHALTKFPQISGNEEPVNRVPPLPAAQHVQDQDTDSDSQSKTRSSLLQFEDPRRPTPSRRPQRPGTVRSPVLFRSPRSSFSRPYDGKSLLHDITSTAEALNDELTQRTPGWQKEGRPLEHTAAGGNKRADLEGK